MEFYDAVRSRQSIRRYKPDPVPEDVLLRVLEAFREAPSWANAQAWEIILVTDLQVKLALQETLSKGNPSRAAVADAPLLVCAVGISGRSGFYKGQPVTARGDAWMLFDLGIATEHLALAAVAEGLGTVHMAYFDFAKAGDILKLPQDRTVVEIIPLGYPAQLPKRVERKALKDFVFQDAYGKARFSQMADL